MVPEAMASRDSTFADQVIAGLVLNPLSAEALAPWKETCLKWVLNSPRMSRCPQRSLQILETWADVNKATWYEPPLINLVQWNALSANFLADFLGRMGISSVQRQPVSATQHHLGSNPLSTVDCDVAHGPTHSRLRIFADAPASIEVEDALTWNVEVAQKTWKVELHGTHEVDLDDGGAQACTLSLPPYDINRPACIELWLPHGTTIAPVDSVKIRSL